MQYAKWEARPDVHDESADAWSCLLSRHDDDHAPHDQPQPDELHHALLSGVPQNLRPRVWLSFSGAASRMALNPDVYANLVAALEPPPSSEHTVAASGTSRCPVLEQIEKDLRRTDIYVERLGPSGAIEALRRVLSAYAQFNPTVGYVQGMNFIVSGLLTSLEEEEAFWLLVLVVEDWLPSHYTEAMLGNHVDCYVLGMLVEARMPHLSTHLLEVGVSTQLLTARWFLTLWNSIVSSSALLRLWDVLFVCGPCSMIQVALACVHAVELPLLAASDLGQVLTGVREALRMADGEALVRIALERVSAISASELAQWRLSGKQHVLCKIADLEAVRVLHSNQRCAGVTNAEVRALIMVADGSSSADDGAGDDGRSGGHHGGASTDLAMGELDPLWLSLSYSYAAFLLALSTLLPAWNVASPFARRLFDVFCASDDGDDGSASASESDERRLSFVGLLRGLGNLLRGSSERRADFCFAVFDRRGVGKVHSDEFVQCLCDLHVLYTPVERRQPEPAASEGRSALAAAARDDARNFVSMVCELWGDVDTGDFSADAFRMAAQQHPLVVQTFQLVSLQKPDTKKAEQLPPPLPPQASPVGEVASSPTHEVLTLKSRALAPGEVRIARSCGVLGAAGLSHERAEANAELEPLGVLSILVQPEYF